MNGSEYTDDYSFDLPDDLIAQYPTGERGSSRLMIYDRSSDSVSHAGMKSLVDFVPERALMVFNDSKVRKARLFGTSSHGGRVEFLLISPVRSDHSSADRVWNVMVKKAKKQVAGKHYDFPGDTHGEIVGELDGSFRVLRFDRSIDDAYLDRHGHVPLPPYINRVDTGDDAGRYQTVYANETGSIAAPTAGLHFTEGILSALEERGVETCFITLHVGIGTFLPVRSSRISDHTMHEERFFLSESAAGRITTAKREGRPVIAVGTTSVRTLEASWSDEENASVPGESSTDMFIRPGYRFRVVDHLFTNFHTPKSTLLMLVSAFCGRDKILELYRTAIVERYRFFSYGDAMLIL